MPKLNFKPSDFDLLDIEFELEVLSGHLEYIEEAVEEKKEESRRRKNQELKSRDLDPSKPEERAIYQDIEERHGWRVDNRIPRILVHPFVLSAWSTYESGAKQMAANFDELLSPQRPFSDIDEKYFCKEMDVFLSQINIDNGFRGKVETRLHRLVEFRNAIAHENARRSGLFEFKDEVSNTDIDYVYPSTNNKYFSLNLKFARRAFSVVERHLNHLMDEYRDLK
jgi:hypothetical protein